MSELKDHNLDMNWLRRAISALESVGIEHPAIGIAYDSIEEVQEHIRSLIAELEKEKGDIKE